MWHAPLFQQSTGPAGYMGAGGPVGILGYHLVIPFYVKLYYKEQPIQLLNTTFPQIVVATTIFFWICRLKKVLYRISPYSFCRNYSFLYLEIVENSNSCCNISNIYLINWFFAAVIRNEDLALNFLVMRNKKFKKHLLWAVHKQRRQLGGRWGQKLVKIANG